MYIIYLCDYNVWYFPTGLNLTLTLHAGWVIVTVSPLL
jgi:hypothetical protein